jgi:hypothetical protein
MADRHFHTQRSPLAHLTAAAVRPFRWAYRRLPSLPQHGYLIACVATRPRPCDHGVRHRP